MAPPNPPARRSPRRIARVWRRRRRLTGARRPRPITMRPIRGWLWRASIEKDLEPGAEVHGVDIDRHANVSEIARAIASRDVHAAAERDGQMGEVAAHAYAFLHRVAGATCRPRVGITELDFRVNEVANRLHASVAAGYVPEHEPGEIGEFVAVPIAARSQEHQHFIGKLTDRRRSRLGGTWLRFACVLDQEAFENITRPAGTGTRATRLPNRSE